MYVCIETIGDHNTCQPFENFMWEESVKITIFKGLFKQSCARYKSYDNLHGGDVWKFYMIYRENLKNQQKIREMPLK